MTQYFYNQSCIGYSLINYCTKVEGLCPLYLKSGWDDCPMLLPLYLPLSSSLYYLFFLLVTLCVPTFFQFMRCSVEGLSVHMFILAILGNVTYGLGILLYSVNGIFLLQKLPWLIGSIGTLCFDVTVSFLNLLYFHC